MAGSTPPPGTGRDLRAEIMRALGQSTGDTPEFWADQADAVVAALHLDDLTAELGRVQAERDEAKAEADRQRARSGEMLDALTRIARTVGAKGMLLPGTVAEEAARVTADRDRLRTGIRQQVRTIRMGVGTLPGILAQLEALVGATAATSPATAPQATLPDDGAQAKVQTGTQAQEGPQAAEWQPGDPIYEDERQPHVCQRCGNSWPRGAGIPTTCDCDGS